MIKESKKRTPIMPYMIGLVLGLILIPSISSADTFTIDSGCNFIAQAHDVNKNLVATSSPNLLYYYRLQTTPQLGYNSGGINSYALNNLSTFPVDFSGVLGGTANLYDGQTLYLVLADYYLTNYSIRASFVKNDDYNCSSIAYDPIIAPTPTSITSFTYSTTTQTVRIRGYWNATTTDGVFEQLEFWQRTNVLGMEDYKYVVATTTGNYDFSFFFRGLPFSTTTLDKPIGLYAWIVQNDDRNIDPNWNPFSDGAKTSGRITTLLVSTSTILTAFDYGIVGNIPPTTRREVSYESCGLTHLDLGDCMANLMVAGFSPSPDDWKGYLVRLNDEIYVHAPLGYLKRFRDIVNETSPSTMPVIDYTFSTSTNSALSSILGGERIYFTPFEYATGTAITSIKSDGANGLPQKNIWEILEPFYTTVIYLALIITIVGEIMGLEMIGGGGGGGGTPKGLTQNSNYKLKEKLYSMERGKYNKIFK